MRYYLIAGEASGDLHGSHLIRALTNADKEAVIRCWGGDLMQEASGNKVVKHYRQLAFMGFLEVVKNLPTILSNLKFCKWDILAFQPDVLVLIDYPGFNLRIAQWAKQHGFKVAYYISPQVWAWKENRVKEMKRSIDEMMVILPFEKDYFAKKWQWQVAYVGHPLIEAIRNFKAENNKVTRFEKPVIALLPGSRKQEINIKLPLMLEVTEIFPEYHFVIAKAPGIEDAFYDRFIHRSSNISALSNQTYTLLQQATAALVTSGTATLETALFGVPQVVCYKGSRISYEIARRVIKVKFISLVNLIMDQQVIPELIQNDLNRKRLSAELSTILPGGKNREKMLQQYCLLLNKLETDTSASYQAAQIITGLASR